jgi:hypothetical protein
MTVYYVMKDWHNGKEAPPTSNDILAIVLLHLYAPNTSYVILNKKTALEGILIGLRPFSTHVFLGEKFRH